MGSRSAAQLRSGEHRYGDFPSVLCPSPAAPRRGTRAGESRAEGAGALSSGRRREQGLGFLPGEGDKTGFPLDNRKTLNWV